MSSNNRNAGIPANEPRLDHGVRAYVERLEQLGKAEKSLESKRRTARGVLIGVAAMAIASTLGGILSFTLAAEGTVGTVIAGILLFGLSFMTARAAMLGRAEWLELRFEILALEARVAYLGGPSA